MTGPLLIGAAGLIAIGAWLMLRGEQSAADQAQQQANASGPGLWADVGQVLGEVSAAVETTSAAIVQEVTMRLTLSKMRTVTAADVNNPNVRALLAVIRRGEGTAGVNGYRTLFGGGLFDSLAMHPNQRITRTMGGRPITSTAAGAYQFLKSTWDETAQIMGLADFSPASQDRGAVGRIAARGALEDAKAGRFDLAVKKIATEWASMPGSPYGQPVITITTARAVYAQAGGAIST